MIPVPVRLLLAATLLAAVSAAEAQPAPTPAVPRPTAEAVRAAMVNNPDEIQQSFTLSDVDLGAALEALENLTGRTILRPQMLPTATITIKINQPMAKSDVVLALETVLSLNQIGVVPMGTKFLKVVPLTQTKGEAPEFIDGSTLGRSPSGKIATKLFQLDFLRANEAFQNGPQGAGLASLLTQGVGGGVVVLAQANAVLVTDTVANLQRLEVLLKEVDRPQISSFIPKFYAVHNQQAADVVTKMKALLTGAIQLQIGTATTFQADERTNQIVVITDRREIPFFDDLIARLDVKSAPNTRTVVIYLKHADAKDMQTLLSSVISGQTAATQKAGNQAVRPEQVTAAAGLGQGQPFGATPAPGQPAQIPIGPMAAIGGERGASAAAGANASEFTSLATVMADERSNSVVVSGTVEDVGLMEELVNQIDIPLAQVRIEVIIAEVTLSDTDISGITALNLRDHEQFQRRLDDFDLRRRRRQCDDRGQQHRRLGLHQRHRQSPGGQRRPERFERRLQERGPRPLRADHHDGEQQGGRHHGRRAAADPDRRDHHWRHHRDRPGIDLHHDLRERGDRAQRDADHRRQWRHPDDDRPAGERHHRANAHQRQRAAHHRPPRGQVVRHGERRPDAGPGRHAAHPKILPPEQDRVPL